jgi:uncharacterized surface protein with fasciclin (FAS1) repeats
MHNKRFLAIKAFVLAALFLTACAGGATVPTATVELPATEAATTEAVGEATVEVTSTTEESSAEATETPSEGATVEATGEVTGTVASEETAEPTDSTSVTGTVEPTEEATIEATGTAEVSATSVATGTAVMTGTTEAVAGDIVDVAMASTSFSTLVRALNAAGLVDTLREAGPFTVFVPADEAFAKLPANELRTLLANPQGLRGVLTYHVVPRRLTSADLQDGATLTTTNGAPLTVRVEGNDLYINDAKVVQRDIVASNGVIYVIDTVLMPPSP